MLLLLLVVVLLAAAEAVRGSGVFWQNGCSDPRCFHCEQSEFAQGACLRTLGGGSVINYCGFFDLHQTIFIFSENCTLYSYEQLTSLDTCSGGGDGLFVQYECPHEAPASRPKAKPRGASTPADVALAAPIIVPSAVAATADVRSLVTLASLPRLNATASAGGMLTIAVALASAAERQLASELARRVAAHGGSVALHVRGFAAAPAAPLVSPNATVSVRVTEAHAIIAVATALVSPFVVLSTAPSGDVTLRALGAPAGDGDLVTLRFW